MDVSRGVSQLVAVEDAEKSLRNRVATCRPRGAAQEIKCPFLINVVRNKTLAGERKKKTDTNNR